MRANNPYFSRRGAFLPRGGCTPEGRGFSARIWVAPTKIWISDGSLHILVFMRITENTKIRLLQELVLDMDWGSAAKRMGLSKGQLEKIKADEVFMERANRIVDRAIADGSGISEAVKRFERTQKVLSQELEAGNMGVAGALIKSHEIEFRMHGLFEKDNSQKVAPVQINISLEAPALSAGVVIDGEKA